MDKVYRVVCKEGDYSQEYFLKHSADNMRYAHTKLKGLEHSCAIIYLGDED